MFKKLDINTAKYEKKLLICCVLWLLSSSVKISFRYLLVLYVNFYVKHLKFAPKWSMSYFRPISAAIFVSIQMIKVICDFNNLVIFLINK